MASVVLGKVKDLGDGTEVTRSTIEAFRAELQKPPKAYHFDCSKCGIEREPAIIDPGDLMCQTYECSDVHATCRTPAVPKTTERSFTFVPGCFVFAPLKPRKKTLWPGIIESCPVGAEGYMIPGKTPGSVKAYFVTFIFRESPDRTWVGGFIDAEEVKPFEKMKLSLYGERGERGWMAEYDGCVLLALSFIFSSLRERLLRFSYVAHAAAKQHIPLGQGESSSSTTQFWEAFKSKRPAEEPQPGPSGSSGAGAPKKLRGLSTTEEVKESDSE